MRYCGIESAKIIGGNFLPLVLRTFSFSKNPPEPRFFCNLNKMCFYYENLQHVSKAF